MDYSGEGQQQRTLDPTNQQLTRWFMDTLRNDNNRTDDENRRDNVVAIRDVLAYSSQLELTDAVGAEVQEPDPETLEVANVLLSFRANPYRGNTQRAVGVIIIISVARRREILNEAVQENVRMFKNRRSTNKKIELSRKKKKRTKKKAELTNN
jgi:hypothetical protein